MVWLKANRYGTDVELDITFEDDDGWGLAVTAEDEAGAQHGDWFTTDFNEMRPFFRTMREMCDKFYELDTQTYSVPDKPATHQGGAMLVELGRESNSGPGRIPSDDR